jgi:PPOX class probable F420-dependent enzyme
MSERIDELPDWAGRLLHDAPVARLGLIDERDRPRVLPITFVATGGLIWTAVDDKPKRDPSQPPARLRYLRRRPEVAVTVDHYEDDWERLAWVQLLGSATILEGDENPGPLDALTRKYPAYLRQPPPGPLISISVERTLHWRAS